MSHYTLLDEDSYTVPQAWFDAQVNQQRHNTAHEDLRSFHDEVRVLRAYHDRELQADTAAVAITRPLTTSPIPKLGGYSDDAIPLCHLWELLVNALVEWPSRRTADLVELLICISKVPGQIHLGEALNDDDNPRSWNSIPFFTMVWSDTHWMRPGMLTRRASTLATRRRQRAIYIKQQDVEARLVSAGLLDRQRAFMYLANALERKPGPDDHLEAENDGLADGQLKLDFHVPVAAAWIRHNARMLYDDLGDEELRCAVRREASPLSKESVKKPRWFIWEERLREIQREESDDFVQKAAGAALSSMHEAHVP